MSAPLPRLALSVHQPWAWAIIFAGKDIENRSFPAIRNMYPALGSLRALAIHASAGMTQEEYRDARDFMAAIGVECPPPALLVRGAVIGEVLVDGVVRSSDSPWWMGPRGIVLSAPSPCDPKPARGALGLFEWVPSPGVLPEPLKWMVEWGRPEVGPDDLFGGNPS